MIPRSAAYSEPWAKGALAMLGLDRLQPFDDMPGGKHHEIGRKAFSSKE
jgi:hypothetical protein